MPSPPSHPGLALLVVEDDPAVRDALAWGLAESYAVHTAATGREACACLRAHTMAAIILDVFLGTENGLDLLPRLRALSLARILVLTGHSTEALAIQALRAGVDDYVKKPVALPDLRAAVSRFVAPPTRAGSLAARAHRYLEEHSTKPCRPAELAGQLGVSEAHLRRSFRDAYGKTPRRHHTEMRMRQALVLLSTTTRGIDEIAWELGYASSTRFGKVFRELHGMTPSEYRASQRRARGG